MKTHRLNRLPSLLRIFTAGALVSAAAAMAFVAVKPPSPSLAAKSDGKATAKLGAKYARYPAFARHFQTLIGGSGEGSRFDGFAQEMYDNTAYPNTFIGETERKGARNAAKKLKLTQAPLIPDPVSWQSRGPDGVNASALVVNESTAGTSPTIFSGRTTAIAVDPNCSAVSCTVFVGTAGGGVWKTTNALAATPTWTQVSDDPITGIPSDAIGSIAFDPHDATGNTLYVGTGEPNGSGDSEAGVGLFVTTDGGSTWSLVSGSIGSTAPCAQTGGTCPVATGRSIGAIAIDPDPAKTGATTHIFIGTDVARHGSSSVNGGRFTPPGVAKVGLYESTDGGATFVAAKTLAQDTLSPHSSNGGDFFRGGCSHIELYRPSTVTQVYASFFDYGVFRRGEPDDASSTTFYQVFNSGGGGTVAASSVSRTEFSLAPNGSDLRVYVGDSNASGLGTLFRVDNANVAATTLFNGTSNVGWTSLSNSTKGTPGFSSFNFCTGQCTYDMPVYSPPGAPGTVYIGGAMQYSEIFTAHPPSNGRAVQRSTDAGVDFTDMTIDSDHHLSLHPDQHAIASTPFNPDIVFIGNDGGVWRLNGSFTDASDQCSSRGLAGTDFTDCEMWLRAIPTSTTTLNQGLTTLQFQSVSLNPANPTADWLGGTQDNGTQAFQNNSWFVTIFGDGGQSGTSPFHSNIRFHNFFDASPDVNFNGDSETGWDVISGPLFAVEPQSFYIPMIFDPTVDGTMFAGLDFVWRTTDFGGNPTTLNLHCNEITGDFPKGFTCGDWVRIGPGSMGPLDATKALGDGTFWGTKGTAGYVVATRRAPSDTNTLWVGTRRGRVFVSSNVNAPKPSDVNFFRIDETGCPTSCTNSRPARFVSGIDVDPSNPNHAFVSYSGYNAYALKAPGATATGHIFEVTYNPGTHTATWSADLATGSPGTLGDQPVRALAVDWGSIPAGDLYAATDFGVFVRKAGTTTWSPAASGLPEVAVYGLTLNVANRILFAGTHGRSIYSLSLP